MDTQTTNYDQYLTRRARNRKIVMAIICVITVILAAAVLTLSFIKVNNRPQFIKNPTESVTIFSSKINGGNKRIANDQAHADEYNKFMAAYEDCFEMSMLSSIFSNNFGNYSLEELTNGAPNRFYGPSDIQEINTADYYVQFDYHEAQSIKTKNGDFYKSVWTDKTGDVNQEDKNKILSFKRVYFAISTENSVQDLNFYVILDGNGTESQYILTVTLKANTFHLYNHIKI